MSAADSAAPEIYLEGPTPKGDPEALAPQTIYRLVNYSTAPDSRILPCHADLNQ